MVSSRWWVPAPSRVVARTALLSRRTADLTRPPGGLLVLMKNGSYQSIFKHWGIVTTGIPASDVKINGAGS